MVNYIKCVLGSVTKLLFDIHSCGLAYINKKYYDKSVCLALQLSLDLHYSEDEIYELSLAREPRTSLSAVRARALTRDARQVRASPTNTK